MKESIKNIKLGKFLKSSISAVALAAASVSAFAATALDNGTAVSGLSGSSGNQIFYDMSVPAGATNLSFNITGGSGDADLYVKFGSQASTSNWDCRPYRSGNNETCDISSVQAGTYSVMIRAYSSYSGVSLVGSFDEPGNPPPPSTGINKAAASGDSITMAFGADCTRNRYFWDLFCLLGGDQPEHSWFDGNSSNVNSVLDKYRALDSSITANKNAAESGSQMTDFAGQAAEIVSQSVVADHVEVVLGGNDICNRDCVDPANCNDPLYTDAQWTQSVRNGLNILMNGLPAGASVLVGSVPRVQDIRAAGVAKQATSSRINCDSIWSTYGVCRIVTNGGTLNGESSATRLAGVAAAQQSYNAIVRQEVEAYNTNSNGLNPNGIELVAEYVDENTSSAGTFNFGASHLNGGDCFHPNVATQSTIANFMWNANPFK